MNSATKTTTMYAMPAPRQIDGGIRWLGWASRAERDRAIEIVRADPAMVEALRPDAIVTIGSGIAQYERGSEAHCAELARTVRFDRLR